MKMYKGKVDVNTDALSKRILLNNQSKYNLESFIFDNLKLKGSERVLEIGCGTGKQTSYIKKKYPNIKLTATDISQQMLSNIKEDVELICKDMDELIFTEEKFDLVLSVYSFYYSKDMVSLCKKISNWLKPNGRIALFGPGAGTNKEIIDLANSVKENSMYHTEDFIGPDQLSEIGMRYEFVNLENKITFINEEDVFTWWENHNSYQSEIAPLLKNKIGNNFELSKNVLGVILNA